MSPEETQPDRAAEYQAQAQKVERGLAWLLVGAALVVVALTLRPGTATLHPPARDVQAEVGSEWDQGQHRGIGVAAGLAALAAVGCAFVFWPRLIRGLRIRASKALPEGLPPLGAESAASPLPVSTPPRAPPLGLGLFVFSMGAGLVLQAGCGGGFLGDRGAGLVVDGEEHSVPRSGIRVVLQEGVAQLSSQTGASGAPPICALKGQPTKIEVEAPATAEGELEGPAIWLVAGTAAPTSETATRLTPGHKGELTPGDSLWVAGRSFSVQGPGLAPILKGAVLGSGLALLGIVFLLALVGRGSEGGTPASGLAAAGISGQDSLREVGRGLFSYLALLPALYLVMLLTKALADALGIPAEHHAFISALQRDPSLAIWVVLAAGVAAPLLEEVLFRGLALTGLSQCFGFWGGLAAQALLFAAVHAGFSHLLPMLLLGWTLGALRRTSPSGSLIAPLVVHALHNGVTLGFVLWALA